MPVFPQVMPCYEACRLALIDAIERIKTDREGLWSTGMLLKPREAVVPHVGGVLVPDARMQVHTDSLTRLAVRSREQCFPEAQRAIRRHVIVIRAALEGHRRPAGVRVEMGQRVHVVVEPLRIGIRLSADQ